MWKQRTKLREMSMVILLVEPKISKKQKAKNLSSNTPDEQHTTTTSDELILQNHLT